MNLTEILAGEAIRFVPILPKGASLYGINLVRAFQQRYGFLTAPTTIEEFDLSRGVTFTHGYFREEFVIEKIQIYNNGLLVDAKTDTTICDNFIDDVIKWGINAGLRFGESNNVRGYFSSLEVELSKDISSVFDRFKTVGSRIGMCIAEYGGPATPFEGIGMTFWGNYPETTGPNTFKIERRAGKPFSANIYFSTAPLTTTDHLSVLKELEAAMP